MKPDFDYEFFSISGLMGALIGIGQLLGASEQLNWRIIIGRALVSAGLASSAPVVLVFFPGIPRIAEFAFAAAFASLGTSGLHLAIQRFLGPRN